MGKPNPFITLLLFLISFTCWVLCCVQWFHYNDHWALFWFAGSVGLGNVVSARVMRYRGAI
jgi:hypothetical protein